MTAPTISNISIPEGNYAIGDQITVTITVNNGETGLTLSSGIFNRQTLTGFTEVGDGIYTAIYTVTANDPEILSEGSIETNIVLQNAQAQISDPFLSISPTNVTIDADDKYVSQTLLPNTSHHAYGRYDPNLITLADGTMLAFWNNESSASSPEQAVFQKLSADGEAIYENDVIASKNDDDADGSYPYNPRIVQLSNGNILFSWNVADHTKAIILSLEDLATETDAIAAIEVAEVLELNDSPYGTGRAGPRNTGLFTTFDGGFSLAEINPHVSTDSGTTGDAVFMKFFNNDGSPATPPEPLLAIRNYDHYEYLDPNVNNILTGYEPDFSVFTFSESSTEFTVFWSNSEPPAWPGEGPKIYTDTFTLSQNTLVSQNGPTNVFDNSWVNEGVQVSTRNLRIVEDPSGDGKIVIFQSTQDTSMQAPSGPYLHIAYLDQSQTPPVLSKPIPVLDENKYSINGTFHSTEDLNDSEHYEEAVGYKINIVDHHSDVIALGNGRFAVAYSTTDNYVEWDFEQPPAWVDWGEQERPSTGIFVQTFKLTNSALVPEGGPIQYTNVFEDLAETSDKQVYHQYPDLTADGTGGYNLIYSVIHYNVSLPRVDDPADDSEVKFLEGRSTPKTNVTIDSISDDTGSANNDFITNDNDGLTINATLSTQLAPGETLEYSADNGATWSDISSAVSGTAITHTDASLTSDATIQMRVTDSAGNSSIPVERTIDVDTEAPKAPELNQVTGDNIINASEAAAGFDITGTGEPGATITLAGPTLAGGNTATVQNDGTWSIPVTKADVTAMGEGNTNLSLTQTDPAGNISDPTTQSITVDALPAILSADMSFGEVLTPDEMDEQADLTVKTANIEDGATISISIDGVSMTPVSATIEANKAVFSASAEELQSLRDGTYEFTLTVTDFPSVQKVQSFKKTGDIDGTENDDTITPTSGPNNTPYADGDGDNVDGGDGTDDYIDAKGGNDIVDGGQGNDIIHGGTGNDILNGGVGDDTLDGGSGNDLLRGDTGNDSLKGGDGQDDLQGGDGDDSLDGGDGNDVLDGGTGADTLTGGAGRDEFKVEAGDTVTDFDIEEDKIDLDDIYNFDTLALWNAENPNNSFSTPLQWLKSDQADGDGLAGLNQNGVPINLMNDGAFINASDLTQTNTGVVCYGAKTRIETIDGLVEIDRLQPGDLVKTGGNGHHPIRWIRGRTIFHAELQAHPNLVPVRIKAGAMGKGLPKRDLIISQHHRMIVSSDLSSAETGSKEIFIAAKDLIGVPGIEIAIDLTEITYWHFICDQHQVVFAEGAASESLYTGPEALKMLGAEARAEIYQIFPELRDAPPLCSKTGPSNLDASRK